MKISPAPSTATPTTPYSAALFTNVFPQLGFGHPAGTLSVKVLRDRRAVGSGRGLSIGADVRRRHWRHHFKGSNVATCALRAGDSALVDADQVSRSICALVNRDGVDGGAVREQRDGRGGPAIGLQGAEVSSGVGDVGLVSGRGEEGATAVIREVVAVGGAAAVAVSASCLARQKRALQRQRTIALDAAEVAGVAGEGAIDHRQRSPTTRVDDAAAEGFAIG